MVIELRVGDTGNGPFPDSKDPTRTMRVMRRVMPLMVLRQHWIDPCQLEGQQEDEGDP